MPNLQDIKRRIGSVKNTQKITRAMKLVAASKLRRAQDAIVAARPYAAKIHEVVGFLAAAVDSDDHVLLRSAEKCDRALLVVITSDKGLCGPFNSGLLRKVERFVAERGDEVGDFDIMAIGRKGEGFFKRRTQYNLISSHPEELAKGANFPTAKRFTDDFVEKFTEGNYDRVYLAYNEFQSAIATNQRIDLILPVQPNKFEDEEDLTEFLFEPEKDALLQNLLPRYVETIVFRAMIDSVASEQGSRMTAMDSATNNASDMISSLTLQYNRARQAAITRELVEITTGAQAISG
jgi:F-type H+-transporting ATPase subunit gamma